MTSNMRNSILAAWFAISWIDLAAAQQPSFDCRLARSATEIAICSDARLSELDKIGAEAFKIARQRQGNHELIAGIQSLLLSRIQCGADKLCIFDNQIRGLALYRQWSIPTLLPDWTAQYRAELAGANAAAVQSSSDPKAVGVVANGAFALSANEYWVVIASRQDPDQAIAIARQHSYLSKPMVVRDQNGWYAVIQGPQIVKGNSGREYLDSLIKSQTLPQDIFLTQGASFSGLVWKPTPPPNQSTTYDGKTDAVLENGELKVTLSKRPKDKDEYMPIATGTLRGSPAFSMLISDTPNEAPASVAALVSLDPGSTLPQVLFTYYWQGAHCCTVTRIATMHTDGRWEVVEGETLDGEGYELEDIEGDGNIVLVSNDNAFYYTFDSYAGSFAPTRIHKLVGGKLIDVTSDPNFHHRLLQAVWAIEPEGQNDEKWHSNGFLAGWVAAKILVGQGQEAWSKMLMNYDHNPDFGPEKCLADLPIDSCPQEKTIPIPFPLALKEFLVKNNYISDESQYPVPAENTVSAPPPHDGSARSNPAMTACTDSDETVRKIIYEIFLGRRMLPNESYDLLGLRDDTTVEGYDASINKTTCAVTYDLNLKRLIGRLAENGDLQRVFSLNRLMQRTGATASKRIIYTVKPTAKEGQTFVEVLP
jgi:uncharacterized protein